MKNMSFIVITHDPSFNAFLMLTIDQFSTIVRHPLGLRELGTGGEDEAVTPSLGAPIGNPICKVFGCRTGVGSARAFQRCWQPL